MLNKKTDNQLMHQKIIWKSRRGMLELDMLLEPFAREVYPRLSEQLQRSYRQLLDEEDPLLYQWLLADAPAQQYAQILTAIHTHAKKGA